ncbi:hypothetical protein PPL_09260 [Heterostelium album PN500]|uniref:Uncharacterized protein n=1 Tax=Heterostelium pallidum (strain ATCC 26659 / Pp 5 / PN500) TaxID=670386 RepID=D3BL28_HETP5|nr:hypothetical protein PPL_09260 [Heterostelium album PN500]EFA77762.1 hypothetical protein PPL_09260 [Heterostelium album PN500]|eukprot:XP_020429890.1 hypothetical protein PPL_09260 [Heterostelium album PN500]
MKINIATITLALIALLLVFTTVSATECPQFIPVCQVGTRLAFKKVGDCEIPHCVPCPRIGIVVSCAPNETSVSTGGQCPTFYCVKNE